MAFDLTDYDKRVRMVIPFYDELHTQTLDLVQTWAGDRQLALLDTGCGTGTFARRAAETLRLSALTVCDPSDTMLDAARHKLSGIQTAFFQTGSEQMTFTEQFDVVTAIQSHHYFDPETRETALRKCWQALRPNGMFIVFENTAPDTPEGTQLLLQRVEQFGIHAGRPPEEARAHSERYGTEYFPITAEAHLALLRKVGFEVAELFWRSYLQSGFYAIKRN